jgi:hypothetical protein
LRAQLAPLFTATRQLLAVASTEPTEINAKLGKIESLISDLNNKVQPRSPATYAQAARKGIAGASTAFGLPSSTPVESARESKQLLVKVNPEDAESLQNISPEQIVKRLQDGGEPPATRNIIAAKKLPSGDVILYLDEVTVKTHLQSDTKWTARLSPSAKVHTKTFPVLLHGISTAGRARDDPASLARAIEADNAKRHPFLKIKKTTWLKRLDEDKRFSSLIVEVTSAEQANRMIREGVLLRYELKTAERFDRRSCIV